MAILPKINTKVKKVFVLGRHLVRGLQFIESFNKFIRLYKIVNNFNVCTEQKKNFFLLNHPGYMRKVLESFKTNFLDKLGELNLLVYFYKINNTI